VDLEHARESNGDKLVEAFRTAWTTGRQFALESYTEPGSEDEAYVIQDKVFAARYPGRRPCAWKAGAARSQSPQSAAPIGEVLPGPATVAAKDFHMFAMEAEVAFRIAQDLPAEAEGWSRSALANAVDEVLVTIELCDTRLADWKTASALWRLADFQLNGALITGSGTRAWRAIDFAVQTAELWINGSQKVERAGSHPMGDPLIVLPWAAGHCARRGFPLRKGDLVTTGSWTGMEFVAQGDTVLARFAGIGEASVQIS
jgi:2-keto-4-pentenoate hydratase